jgi:large subunit ribosomal protein L30
MLEKNKISNGVKVKVQLIKSLIDQIEPHKKTARALGLRRTGDSREHQDTPQIRGMIRKIRHLVKVTEV